MLKIKLVCFIKRLIITALVLIMLAFVESLPQYPLFYILVCLVSNFSIRFLWKSSLKDEDRQKKRTRVRFSNQSNREYHRKKAA